jgi:putative ABC transport system ATP-binding protein
MMKRSAIRLRASGLHLDHGTRAALQGVSLDVERGEVVAVVGPSGAGKSTLLHVLCGLLEPHRGWVEVDGTRITGSRRAHRDRVRRERFGFVLQFGELVPELTIRENVELPLRLRGCGAREATTRAMEQLDALGIADLGPAEVPDVSGGEMQRVAIARALVHRPDVILADEPTGALDGANAEVVLGLLLAHASEQAASVVIVTHERWLADGADRTLTLQHGRLAR